MKLTSVLSGYFKLDGGAMFGVVPKTLWSKKHPPDPNNLCTWAMRCLLIETGDRKILVDTGIGNKQSTKWRTFFEPHGKETLLGSLKENHVSPEDITDVFLTHLHFDHCGGAIYLDDQGNSKPTFPNAVYWSNESHWQSAMQPNPREEASFLKENFKPLFDRGHISFLQAPKQEEDLNWLPGIDIRFVYGHTQAMMLPIIRTPESTLAYCADLIPSAFHLGKPYVMAYDIRPLETIKEKSFFFKDVLENNWTLMFEHDPNFECASVKLNERGRIVVDEHFDLKAKF